MARQPVSIMLMDLLPWPPASSSLVLLLSLASLTSIAVLQWPWLCLSFTLSLIPSLSLSLPLSLSLSLSLFLSFFLSLLYDYIARTINTALIIQLPLASFTQSASDLTAINSLASIAQASCCQQTA